MRFRYRPSTSWRPHLATIQTDVVIVGAGPCGLFQVFELGLLGLKAEVVDSIREAGGQCIELYPDKPIYDIPAVPECTGRELIDSLMKQIEPFGAGFHLGQEVTQVKPTGDRFYVETAAGQSFDCGAVVIAGGLGSFQPRRIRAAGVEDIEFSSLQYRVKNPDDFAGKKLVIFGGGDSALDWLLALEDKAEHITLVHRRDEYRAMDVSVERMRALASAGRIDVYEKARATQFTSEDGQLVSVSLADRDGNDLGTVTADAALVFFGLAPKLGPIAEWNIELQRKSVPVDTEKFQTSVPGIYAVGDINTYPGKKKLILSGFHEAALAAFAIKQQLNPDQKVHLQYTTTSPIMHERLGKNPDV
ncbi:MAG: NAD(P)/FAD-dependent oxidoreductase [Pseudomonadota bacterium]